MAKDYGELVDFMQDHRGNPVALAKIITAWCWTSLFPGGPTEPTSAASVCKLLSASCGWRDILMDELFDEIGIQHRRANFHDVPFQVNHSATELFINGKWIFFDPTFGIYLTNKSGRMLSMEEARDDWPNVIVKQCSLPGWQGKWIDPDTISASAFKTVTDPFFYYPVGKNGFLDTITGEINSLYFGYRQSTLTDAGQVTYNNAGDHSYSVRIDSNNKADWYRIITRRDDGKLDFQFGYYDKNHKDHSWFTDYDQLDKFSWRSQMTVVRDGNLVDAKTTAFDDRSKTVVDYDVAAYNDFAWKVITTYYLPNGRPDKQTGVYDDGRTWILTWDQVDQFAYSRIEDTYAANNGMVLTSIITHDDGTQTTIDWSTVNIVAGANGGETLFGTGNMDFLRGFRGNDILWGLGGADRMEGGPGNDIYYVADTSDIIVEKANAGIDTVDVYFSFVLTENFENLVLEGTAIHGAGNKLDNSLRGNVAGNVFSGFAGDDRLFGAAGNDKLVGGPGNDLIEGGLGADRLYGSAGADTFFWRDVLESRTAAPDRVFDFSRPDGDKINLRFIDARENANGSQAFTFIGTDAFTKSGQVRFTQKSGDTYILLNADHDKGAEAIIRVEGLHTPDKAWFVL